MWEILNYLSNPYIVLAHVIGFGLFVALLLDGVARGRLWRSGLLAESASFLLWFIFEPEWAAIIAIAIFIHLYERIDGPRVRIEKDAAFLLDEECKEALISASDQINLLAWPETTSQLQLVVSDLRYAEYWKTFFGKPMGQLAVDIDEIILLQEGADPEVVKCLTKKNVETADCCFVATISSTRSVTYIAESRDLRDRWLEALNLLVGKKVERYREIWMKKLIKNAGFDIHQGITLDEALMILEKANRPSNKTYMKELFNFRRRSSNSFKGASIDQVLATFAKASVKSSGEARLDEVQFNKFFELAIKRPEIQQIFDRLLYKRKGEVSLSPKRLHEFMEEQHENIPVKQCRRWVQEYEQILPPHSFSCIGFTSFMLSFEQNLFMRHARRTYQDMTQPLSHYFIATSHNTYLTKDQLKGKSSVGAYISALQRGCKCVELDIWDGPNNEPIIYHGHTLTSKILFKDVVQAIADHAFDVSPYPVILSFENHCSIEQQRVMATHLVDILGDMLYLKPMPENETMMPSPADLQGYIIIKAKKLSDNPEDDFDENDESDFDEDSEDEEPSTPATPSLDGSDKSDRDSIISLESLKRRSLRIDEKEETEENGNLEEKENIPCENGDTPITPRPDEINGNGHVMNGKRESLDREISATSVTSEENGDENSRRGSSVMFRHFGSLRRSKIKSSDKKKKKPLKIAAELSDLVVYCQAVRFKGFEHAKENRRHFEMSSFGEKKSLRFVRENSRAFIEYNRRMMSRIYPAGHRVDSSNFDPQPLWSVGCHMVALNYQTPDKSMQLNQGLFQDNGGCGYVLKPEFLRSDNSTFDPKGPYENREKFLVLQIICGCQLPFFKDEKLKAERSLTVHVKVSGVDADKRKEKTKSVKNNGYNPVWNDLIGFKLRVPELALVSFTVREGDNFLGQYTLPFTCIQRGYRTLPLMTKDFTELPYSHLLVHTEVKDCH